MITMIYPQTFELGAAHPPYGLGEEDWDRNAWSTEFYNLFKKIQAVDQITL